jgi:hypothetical protein
MFVNRNPASPNFLSRQDKKFLSNLYNSSRKCRCVLNSYRLLRFAVFLPERRAVVRPLFFAGRPVLFFAAFFGTFAPALLASDNPIAIACLRLVTFLPLRPLRRVPRFFSRITFAIFLFAPFEYFAIMICVWLGSEIVLFVVKYLASHVIQSKGLFGERRKRRVVGAKDLPPRYCACTHHLFAPRRVRRLVFISPLNFGRGTLRFAQDDGLIFSKPNNL